MYKKIESQDDVSNLRTKMAKGNYPPDISDCYVVGINGDCGYECPVFLRGGCEYQTQMEKSQKAGEHHGSRI